MEKLTLPGNRGYLLAGIGGIEALFTFLFLPYISFAFPESGGVSITFNSISYGGLIWFEAIFAAAAIAISALLIYRTNPFGLSTTPVETQVRWGIYALIGVGALGILCQIIAAANVGSLTVNGQTLGSSSSGTTGYNYSTGFWFYLIFMAAVVGGGVLALRTVMTSSPYASQQYWPSQTQYPPYQQQAPSVPDYVSYPQQPGQSYPAYDPQQWQPTQQSQQQPSQQPPPNPAQQWQPTQQSQQPPSPPQPPYGSQQWQPTQMQPPSYPQQQWPPTQPPQSS